MHGKILHRIKKKGRRTTVCLKPIPPSLSSWSNVSNNDSRDEFHHESYSQALRVWTAYNRQQQQPAATSKGRSTSRHSTPGTYDNHVTHFLHDNVTVEFHYWRIDWGIAEPRIFLSGYMNGGHQRTDDSHRMHGRVQINAHIAVSNGYRRFSVYPLSFARNVLSHGRWFLYFYRYDTPFNN